MNQILKELSQKDHSEKSINALNLEIGKWFLGTPYVEKTLEIPGEEKLVIDFQGLDCTTYLETVVTLSRLVKYGNLNFEDYEKELEFLRYRDGSNTGYPSRLHYFSEWIYENQKKGILDDITAEIGGKPYANKPSFMSSNPQYYPQLSNAEYLSLIRETEKEIGVRDYYYIPKEEIQKLENKIKPGDLIAITAARNDLDMVHVGFAVEKNGRVHLMHASSGSMKVEISEKPLSEYLAGFRAQSGVMVCRFR
ncbi:N-acetylmuramoyl-L-alanine amidase-like domain-containing protein [Cecembia rubra]|uniref:N-acetylmuramoyl-L-alanine amidase-like domain-containing protein n=1 Tax=Cecembia rubra TaxID=1485585 RepID=UPI001FE8A5CB|nr:N-acetylmuramoyl-L-alanine amidase-like domain-containing protein [Cecembia rubra]